MGNHHNGLSGVQPPSSIPDQEKETAIHEETSHDLTPEDREFLDNFTDAQRKKVLRKVDWRLVPMLAFLYLIAFLDRANIGNAKIEGLMEDLQLSGEQYNIALSVFFVPYILLGKIHSTFRVMPIILSAEY